MAAASSHRLGTSPHMNGPSMPNPCAFSSSTHGVKGECKSNN